MKIAVTGAHGDLGSGLIPFLLEQGHDVVGIDLVPPRDKEMGWVRGLRTVFANTGDFGEFVGAVEGCDALIHLAAHRSPMNQPAPVVYANNTQGSYNALYAAAVLGIQRVCLASSINAIGGVYSREPRYDYFPVDEAHPTYAEDPYSLSKWVLEQQGDAFARRYADMRIASLRFHWILDTRARALEIGKGFAEGVARHLWAYTLTSQAVTACYRAITADFTGHEVFYITAPQTASETPSLELAAQYYPNVEIRGSLEGHASFFDCSRAARILGWTHEG